MTDPKQPRSRPHKSIVAALAALALAWAACSDGGSSAPAPSKAEPAKPTASKPATPAKPSATPEPTKAEPAEPDPAQLVARGRQVYMANCIACHSQNPAQDGALGPAVAGSSYALVEARVMHGTYPEGYTPKRSSKVMIPLPHLANELTALTAYLDSVN